MSDSTKEVVHHSIYGLEVVQPGQPGLETALHNPQLQTYSQVPYGSHKPSPAETRVCGLRKVTFWLVAALAALTIIAIGVPVGLMVGRGHEARAQEAGAALGATTPSQPGATVTVMTTATAAVTAASATASSSMETAASSQTSTAPSAASTSVKSVCPQGNNTIMTPSLGTLRYRVLCDSDFAGAKQDLALMVVPSFGDCMNLCNSMNYFQKRTDVGCTYNAAGTGTQTPGTCWCLGGETKSVVTNVGNQVAAPV